MGLDMYLSKRHYVKNWNFMKPEQLHNVTVKRNGEDRKDIDTSKVSYIIEEVMYWRKANAIHAWFVKNVQDGNDDCGDHLFNREGLEKLLEDIKTVLTDNSKAEEILPSQSGFFFGGTDYDQYYFRDLEETRDVLEKELAIKYEGFDIPDYIYDSSW